MQSSHPSIPQVDVDGECGAELTTLKLSWFNPVGVNDGGFYGLQCGESECLVLHIAYSAFEVSTVFAFNRLTKLMETVQALIHLHY